MVWQEYFQLVKLTPGRVIVQGYGEIDFSKEVSPELCLDICENTTGVLKITEKGMEKFYGLVPPRPEGHPSTPERTRAGLQGVELKAVVVNKLPEKKRNYRKRG